MRRALALAFASFAPLACGDAAEGAADTVDTAADTAAAEIAPEPGDVAAEAEAPPPRCATAGMGPAWTIDDVAAAGPFAAASLELDVTDPDRPTAAHGLVPETAGRTIGMRVWYPAASALGPLARDAGPFPLLVHSHGFSSNRNELSYAAEWLATRGYVVAELEFPLTRLTLGGTPVFEDVVNQPADVSFAIDQLLAKSALAGDPLFGGIDAERIALSGVSLGGLTTLLATYHRDWHDPRVKAAIDMAGPSGFFTPTFYSFVPLPSLLVYGDTDAIVDYAQHALPARERAPAGTLLATLTAGSHTAFAGAASLMENFDNPDLIGCDAIDGQIPDQSELLATMADPAIGIEVVAILAPCQMDPLPRAMRPSRQMLLTRLLVYAWLELQLADDAARRASACAFLDTLDAADDLTLE